MDSDMNSPDPFTGTWRLNHQDSLLAGQPPQRWVQKINATDENVIVHEEIVFDTGIIMNVMAEARFDGEDYPVYGSPVADTIAYKRLDNLLISGTAKKAGIITVIEIVSVSHDHSTLTMKYSIRGSDGQEVSSVAVFKKELNES